MVEAMEPRPRLDGRFFPPILRVVVMVTWGWSMASAWVRCLVVEVGTSGSSFTTTLGPSATPELILLHTALCASRMNSSSARSLCSAWICSCSFLFFSSCSSTCPCRVSVWSTLLFLHLAAASLFLSLLCLLLSSSSGQSASSSWSLGFLPPPLFTFFSSSCVLVGCRSSKLGGGAALGVTTVVTPPCCQFDESMLMYVLCFNAGGAKPAWFL